ncbi:MAG: aminotransferase class I/II-fold pyridoxal phosphate-dependent enzyme [Deltaproteobacteria bacterium]
MTFPERFSALPDYAFPRLRKLLEPIAPGGPVIDMTIGEPKHAFPAWVGDVIAENLAGFGRYPANDGTPELLAAIAAWITRRYGVTLDASTQIMALNGTREGLFNAGIALCPEQKNGAKPVVLMPNPFYQAYALAALAVSAEPIYVAATASNAFLPDYSNLPRDVLDRTALCYICSPANPQGSVASRDYWRDLIALAEHHDFQILADECYSEIYRDTPPYGALQAAKEFAADPERIVVFNSLSKRSSLPGLRAGFVAGGPESIKRIKQLRAFAGAPLPLPLQAVATRAWQDEVHVSESRALYNEKFDIAARVFAGLQAYHAPDAGFFLWLPVADDETAVTTLWQKTGVKMLPGSYLSRTVDNQNPGKGYIRVALVGPASETEQGLTALRDTLY